MFFFKKIRYLFLFIFFLFFILITYFASDHENRRSIISRILVLHDFYRIKTLNYGLQVRDFTLLSEKLSNYINFSKSFSNGRTYMFPGIYEATELVVSRAVTQDDYNKIENVLEQLLEFDDRIYKLHVWYARAVSDQDYKKALEHIDIAIKISPAENDAYRLALFIAQKLNEKKLANFYCEKYNNAFLGGNLPIDFGTLFNSFNNHKFFLEANNINEKNSLNFINSNLIINKKNKYEFIFDKSVDLNGVNLYLAPLTSLILQVDKIDYFSKGTLYSINPNNLIITSNYSYLLEKSDGSLEILTSQLKEDVLKLRHESLKDIEKLQLTMNIKKMPITNSNLCEVYE